MSVKIAGDLQTGNVIIYENTPVVIMKREFNKSGRNAAVVKLRMKNILTGRNSESVFKADDKVEGVTLEKKDCTYSYFAPPMHVFVDTEFNEYEIESESVADIEKFLAPDMTDICEVTFYEGRTISVLLPKSITREVEYTEPARARHVGQNHQARHLETYEARTAGLGFCRNRRQDRNQHRNR